MEQETRRITQGVAHLMLESLLAKGDKSPTGKAYTMPMVRNFLYGYRKNKDQNIQRVYVEVVTSLNPEDKGGVSEEKRTAAKMHLDMAERILSPAV